MNILDLPALIVELENQQLDQQAGQPLPVPENQPAKSDAVLQFMKNLLNQTAHTPEEQQHQQQIASAQLHIEQYYDEKVADYDLTGKRPTKYELEALEDRIQATLGFEISKKGTVEKAGDLDLEFEAEGCKLAVDCQRTSAATIASLATNDAESATEWILISHHLARVIAGKAQQRWEQALAPPMFRGLLGPDVSTSDVFGKTSKQKLKEQAKTTKLIEHPKEISATNPKPVVQPAEVSQSTLTTSSTYQQAQSLIQILPLPQPFTFKSSNLPNQQQQQGSFNSFRGLDRCRGGPYKRDRSGNIYPYNNSNANQSSQFYNRQNKLLLQLATFMQNQASPQNHQPTQQPKQK
ncbi:MAG: hypothetical protein EZS28_010924 [Streblomastix strix]|uniref:Uncharacterized protein n=1 Tax=Streblomastix strix TaxID=222440 RepID=A0A5J4WF59_9EUKA|nr:MAG: hypothetical protein EZS28_010924 [Streblomastix strix]